MEKRRIQHIILDMDGTLLNNREPCYFAVKHTLKQFGVGGNFFQDDFRKIWGCSIDAFWRRAGIPDYVPFEEVDKVFWDFFPVIAHTMPFDGTGKALYDLSHMGLSLSLLTAAKQHDIEAFHNLPGHNGSTMYDLITYSHPRCVTGKRDAISEIMQRLGAKPENTAFVEDCPFALGMAKELGLLTIGMLEGYASEERIIAAKPHHLIRSPLDLVGIIKTDYL